MKHGQKAKPHQDSLLPTRQQVIRIGGEAEAANALGMPVHCRACHRWVLALCTEYCSSGCSLSGNPLSGFVLTMFVLQTGTL